MNERIKELRKALNLNQTEFGERICIKQTTVAGYENGSRQPMDAVIASICKEFKVNEEWLRTGKGDMFLKLNKKDELLLWASTALSNESEDFRNRFVSALSELDVNDWELLANMAETLANQKKKN